MLHFPKWDYITFKLKNENKLQFKKQEGKSFCSDKLILKVLIGGFVIDVPCDMAFKIISDIDWVTLVNKFQVRKEFSSRLLGSSPAYFLPFPEVLHRALPFCSCFPNFSSLTEMPHRQEKENQLFSTQATPSHLMQLLRSQRKMSGKSQEEFKLRGREESI